MLCALPAGRADILYRRPSSEPKSNCVACSNSGDYPIDYWRQPISPAKRFRPASLGRISVESSLGWCEYCARRRNALAARIWFIRSPQYSGRMPCFWTSNSAMAQPDRQGVRPHFLLCFLRRRLRRVVSDVFSRELVGFWCWRASLVDLSGQGKIAAPPGRSTDGRRAIAAHALSCELRQPCIHPGLDCREWAGNSD